MVGDYDIFDKSEIKSWSHLAIAIIKKAVEDGDDYFFTTDYGMNLVELANFTTVLSLHSLKEYARMQKEELLMETPDIFSL